MLTEENRGCPRSRAFRDLGFHVRVNLGISFDGGTKSLIFFITTSLVFRADQPLASPSLFTLFLFLRATHCVAGSVSSHRLPERIPAHTRSSEVNATKYPGISYFGYRRRKTRKIPCPRPDVGRYVKRCVVAEGGRKDIRRRATNGRVARWILGMGRGTRRKEIQPGDPVRVWICAGISICISQTYRRNWTPVNIA